VNLEEYSNTKFHENLFSGSRVVPCRRKDRIDLEDRSDDDNKFFWNFAEAP